MELDWLLHDRVIKRIHDVLETCTAKLAVGIESIVVFGSKARGVRNSQNDYEIMLLVSNGIDTAAYIKLINTIRLEIIREKLYTAKVQVYTPDIFEDLLYGDKITGTFLYMLCKENVVLFDRHNTFAKIKEGITQNTTAKTEEEFIRQCIEFSRMFGSEKWVQKWEKVLMQYKYLKKRREF